MDTCKRMWSKNEIEDMAGGGAAGGIVYRHLLTCTSTLSKKFYIIIYSSKSDAIDNDYIQVNPTCLIGGISTKEDDGIVTFDRMITKVAFDGPLGNFSIGVYGLTPTTEYMKIDSDDFAAI